MLESQCQVFAQHIDLFSFLFSFSSCIYCMQDPIQALKMVEIWFTTIPQITLFINHMLLSHLRIKILALQENPNQHTMRRRLMSLIV